MINPEAVKVESDFNLFYPAISEEEAAELLNSLLHSQNVTPVYVWRRTLVDDPNKFRLCMKHHLSVEVIKINAPSYDEAVVWACANCLDTYKNIEPAFEQYLIGKIHETLKIIYSRKWATSSDFPFKFDKNLKTGTHQSTVSMVVANKYNRSEGVVKRCATYANALDKIARTHPEIRPLVFAEEEYIRIPQVVIFEIAKLSEADTAKVINAIKEHRFPNVTVGAVMNFLGKKHKSRPNYRKLREMTTLPNVKDNPEYDPDSEFKSLIFTIPSWIGSLNRTMNNGDFQNITASTRAALEEKLWKMMDAASDLIDKIKE